MKRIEFRMEGRSFETVEAMARSRNTSVSDLIREALMEKVERERVLSDLNEIRSEIDGLVSLIREEGTRSRRELAEDAVRLLELQRKDMAGSLKRNDEMIKTFVQYVASHEGKRERQEKSDSTSNGKSDWAAAG